MTDSRRTLQETRTALPPAEVLALAKRFFARRNNIYAAFLEREGPGFVTFRGQGGEEIVLAAQADGAATRVTGSTYLFDQQVARFFVALPPAPSAAPAPAVSPAPSATPALPA